MVREQHVAGSGRLGPHFGYSETSTYYEYETRFFVRCSDGQEEFYQFPGKDMAIRDGHWVTEVWARAERRRRGLRIALYNHTSRMTYWLESEETILAYFRVSDTIAIRERVRTPEQQVEIEKAKPWILLVALISFSLLGVGCLFWFRAPTFVQIIVGVFGVVGVLSLLLWLLLIPTHLTKHEDNPAIAEIWGALNEVLQRLEGDSSLSKP